jgi:SAM-dependent methyltransferase
MGQHMGAKARAAIGNTFIEGENRSITSTCQALFFETFHQRASRPRPSPQLASPEAACDDPRMFFSTHPLMRRIARRLWHASPFARSLFQRLMRLALQQATPIPPPAQTFNESGLLAGTDTFNAANERYFAAMDDQAKAWVAAKPFSDALHFGRHLHDVGLLVHWLRLAPGDVVLELGSGTCWLSSLLNRFGCPTIAVDVSPTALDLGRKLFERESGTRWDLDPQFLPYDGHHIPLPDGSVDRVICYDAFHHVPNQSEILGELVRVLRPGGIFGMVEPGRRHSLSATSKMEMDETGVLENDIIVEDVRRRALEAGFTDAKLVVDAIGAGFEIPADKLDAFIAGDWLSAYWAQLTQHLVAGHMLFLHKGAFIPTTRRPELLKATITPGSTKVAATAGKTTAFSATVVNHSPTRWLSGPAQARGTAYFGGHLHREGEAQALHYGWLWLPLPHDVEPGATVRVEGVLPAIPEPGRYRLVLDLVADQVTWFTHQGSPTVDVTVEVR